MVYPITFTMVDPLNRFPSHDKMKHKGNIDQINHHFMISCMFYAHIAYTVNLTNVTF